MTNTQTTEQNKKLNELLHTFVALGQLLNSNPDMARRELPMLLDKAGKFVDALLLQQQQTIAREFQSDIHLVHQMVGELQATPKTGPIFKILCELLSKYSSLSGEATPQEETL